MNTNYDSFLEIAVALMKKKKKPQSLESLTKEVFSKKGIEGNELEVAQFQVDFMISGYFVCCGEDKSGNQLWDLKTRQLSSFLDKDSGYMRDMSEEDAEAKYEFIKGMVSVLKEKLQYVKEITEHANIFFGDTVELETEECGEFLKLEHIIRMVQDLIVRFYTLI